jgi:TolB protein
MADVASGSQSVIAGNASQPAFNKDGSLFAYRSWDLGTRGIFFRDFVGGRGGQVTRFVEDGLPTWAPDGFSFALMSRREGDRVARLYRGDQLGQGDTPIGFQGEYPSAMPDGRLVVRGCLPNGDCGIFTIGPNGGGENKISGDRGDNAPAPSPDGSKIAFMSAERGAKNWEIWVMNADGSNPQQLTNNGSNDGLPAWSPDGQSIAFVSDQGGQWAVWVMNADGSNQRKLFNMNGSPDGIVLIDTNNSRGWLEERLTWAP